MKKVCAGLLLALTLLSAADLDAQRRHGGRDRDRDHDRDRGRRHVRVESHRSHDGIPLAVEARFDAAIPVGNADDDLDTGLGWGVTGLLDLAPAFAIYVGYSSFQFEIEDSEDEVEDDGLDVGGRVSLGTGGGAWRPYAQFGALFHDGETGFEAGLGGDYGVGRLSVTPLVRYRNVDELDYLTLGMGLNLRF